jgi:oligopeptide/dipeptide ABC transporter ATP-binding protein
MKPELLICDEVVSALDVSIQGQILNLLLDLREKRGLSFLFIAHDLKVACYFCDRIGVMYRGELMEEAAANTLWKNGVHPYTELLFSSVARPEKQGPLPLALPAKESRKPVVPEPREEACAFAARCPYAEERCFREKPPLRTIEEGHKSRCFR